MLITAYAAIFTLRRCLSRARYAISPLISSSLDFDCYIDFSPLRHFRRAADLSLMHAHASLCGHASIFFRR